MLHKRRVGRVEIKKFSTTHEFFGIASLMWISVCEMTKFYFLYYLFNCINPNVKIVFVNEKNRKNCKNI